MGLASFARKIVPFGGKKLPLQLGCANFSMPVSAQVRFSLKWAEISGRLSGELRC